MRVSRSAALLYAVIVIFDANLSLAQNLIATPKDWIFTYIQGAKTRTPRPSVAIPTTSTQSSCTTQPGSASLGYWKYHLTRDGQKCWYPSRDTPVVFRDVAKSTPPSQSPTPEKFPVTTSTSLVWTLDPSSTTVVAKTSDVQQNSDTLVTIPTPVAPHRIEIPPPSTNKSSIVPTIAFLGVAQIILIWVILHMLPKFDRRKKLMP